MKFKYWLRKLCYVYVAVIFSAVYTYVFLKHRDLQVFVMMLFLMVLLLCSQIYPKKNDFCKCGNKWTKRLKFKETTKQEKKFKDGSTRITYTHVFTVDCKCSNCGKTTSYEISASGGYDIIDTNGKLNGHKIKHTIYLQNNKLL